MNKNMNDRKQKEVIHMQKKKCSIWYILGTIVVVAAVIVILPKAIQIISAKLYKMKSADQDLDIENMGPEIVKKEVDLEEADKEDIFEEE